MKQIIHQIIDLYVDGFRNMTVGKTLWAVIIIKLVIIFLVLKLFFFPNFIRTHSQPGHEDEFVSSQLEHRQP